ncbi:hypothetical protein B0A49_01982 [Cryomyces minteri]|uniref:ubiquitinyl hydrolase 1 n=1 Tax=Cryomyces minteri TaxID=331657 RepID=A0A4U0XL41_9PEZI|nr:hypothetical protein B0A49_01982 [Cryomyces minteri]
MPARLVSALGFPSSAQNGENDDSEGQGRHAKTFAAKGEVLRKYFGLEKGGLLKSIQGDRSLRTLGSLSNGTKADAPPGLGNWDNSCYQNSVIQGLASLRYLPNFLSEIASNIRGPLEDITSGALSETMKKLTDPTNNGERLWTPSKLKAMSSWQQQDAQEYFSKIIENIEKEYSRAWTKIATRCGLEIHPSSGGTGGGGTYSRNSTKPVFDLTESCVMQGEERETHIPRPATNPLEGLLAQRVGCMRCGFTEGLSMIPFNCLTVPLGRDHAYDLHDCFHEYTKLELIEGVECAKCTLLRTEQQLDRLLTNSAAFPDNGGQVAASLPESVRSTVASRLPTVRRALDEEDFSDSTLAKKCQIPKNGRVSGTKSRQAVIARAPQSLVVHVNRSLFDEYTGAQKKNYAEVNFEQDLDLSYWCLGPSDDGPDATEEWVMDPARSMLRDKDQPAARLLECQYELRAAITHYGRHENGHYICYRRHPQAVQAHESSTDMSNNHESPTGHDTDRDIEQWWRLSDEDVSAVSEEDVLQQCGAFMLFYERKPVLTHPPPVETTLTVSAAIQDISKSSILETELLDTSEVMDTTQHTSSHDVDESLVSSNAFVGNVPEGLDIEPSELRAAHSHTSPSATSTKDGDSAVLTPSDAESDADDVYHVQDYDKDTTPVIRVPSVPVMRTAGLAGSVHADERASSPFHRVAIT